MLTEIEEVLKERKRVAHEKSLDPMAVGELTSRVEESIADYKAGRVKGSKELLKKYGQRDMKILWSEFAEKQLDLIFGCFLFQKSDQL